MNPRLLLFGLLNATILVSSYGMNPEQTQPVATTSEATQNILKVTVLKGGEITSNGIAVSMEQLDAMFQELIVKKGVVWYYREGANEEPHPNATKVIGLIIKHRLPVRLSTKPDYSDSVTP